MECFRIGAILIYKVLGDLCNCRVVLVGAPYELVVYVRKVLYKRHFIAPIFQITSECVEYDEGTSVADVDEAVDGRAADIHADLSLPYRNELFLLLSHGVV